MVVTIEQYAAAERLRTLPATVASSPTGSVDPSSESSGRIEIHDDNTLAV